MDSDEHGTSMKKIKHLILITVRENLRGSIFLLFLFLAAGLIVSAWFVAPFTLGESSKIVRDIGLAAATLTGIVMAIVLGSRLLYRDLKKNAVYTLLTRPASAEQIVVGKFLGIAIILFFIECALHLILQFIVLFTEGSFDPPLLISLPYALLETYIVLGFVFLFSAFSTASMGIAAGIMCYVAGHAAFDIKSFAIEPGTGISGVLAHALYFLIPHLEHFNFRMQIVYGMPLHCPRMIFSLCYGIMYILMLTVASVLVFRKRQYP